MVQTPVGARCPDCARLQRLPTFSMTYGSGYAISEVISRVVNRKRGKRLAVIAGVALVISYSVTLILEGGFPSGLFNIVYDILALALGIFAAVNHLR